MSKNLPATITENEIGLFLQKEAEKLSSYAVRKYDKDAFIKSAFLAIVQNENLSSALQTKKGQSSLIDSLKYAATTGLSLNPQEGKAALIGYKNKSGETIISYQVMKNGMVELAMDSGKIDFLQADYVKENDFFELKKSINGDDYNFSPAKRDRGEIIGFYAAVKFKNMPAQVKWMTVEEMNEHRDNYSAMYRYKKEQSPWHKSFSSMGIKTIIKALLRSFSISSELDTVIGADDFLEADFKIDEKSKGVSAVDAKNKLKEKDKPENDDMELL